MVKKKMWTILVHLTKHWVYEQNEKMPMDQDFGTGRWKARRKQALIPF